jgi:hypothetical protein
MHSGTPSKRWKGTDVKKIRKSIAEIKDEIYDVLGGIAGAVKYYKRHPSAFYPDYFKTPPQPLVTNNSTINNVSIEAAGEDARRKLETAFMGLIAARQASIGDPAVYVGGERLQDPQYVDGRIIEHHPSTAEPRPATDDAVSPLDESSKSPKKGPLNPRGGVATTPGATNPTGGQKTKMSYSNSTVPGLAAGAALDGLDDNLSTTQKFLNWKGHGGPP